MKIGLFLGSMSPMEGGAYTLLIDQLSALSRLHKSCGHEIVLFHHQAGSKLAEQFSEFPSVHLDAARLGVRTEEEFEGILRKREEQRLLEEEQRMRAIAQDQKRHHEFERRRQNIGRISEFASRIYAALYDPSRSPGASISQPAVAGQVSEGSPTSWQASIYRRERIQFLIYLAPWFGEIVMDIPFALMLWDLQHRGSPWFPEVSAGQEWNRREQNYAELLRRATVIYTGTEKGRDEAICYYHVLPERVKVLPFLTPSFMLQAARRPKNADRLLELEVPASYLFYPAQFWAHKNHVVVLDACKIVRDKTGWDLGVVFTGADKGNMSYVQEYAERAGLEKNVRFAGFVEREDILELYKGAFCLVFPTFFGPDNLPPLEAFALSCPVIASDIPGAREQLGDAAILVPPTDERALANSILSLRNGEVRAQLINAGLKVANGANWDDYGQRILDSVDEFAAIRRAWP
jgi:glycosyltransferase involved in cell wall biosynthesis